MDLVALDGVTAEVLDALDLVGLLLNLHLVRLHHFLNLLADVSQTDVDAGGFDSRVGRVFDCGKEVVVDGVECNSERAIGHQPSDMGSVIDLHDVAVLKHGLVANVRGPVGRAMVKTCASWERDTSFQAVRFDESSVHGFDLVANIHNFHARPDETLSVLASLSVDLRGTAQIVVVALEKMFLGSQFRRSDSMPVVVKRVLQNLTDWESALLKLLTYGDGRRVGLLAPSSWP